VTASLALWSRSEFPEGDLPRLIDEAFTIVGTGYQPAVLAENGMAPEPGTATEQGTATPENGPPAGVGTG